ncbi:GNAT family N-acetyltransferase [Salarchaeum japonicum]|uniref:GNAT family N-acetyltransferase n=1 Tax=Salarchaeum japonicum TaxID=555573 RepID=A0AAV3SY03_9EURY|nr:GNAT family N-acetyltransferase [Salarchaeum japonicum]
MEVRRLASPDDLAGLQRVNALAWRAAYSGLVPESVLDSLSTDVSDDTAERRFEELRDADGRVFVAERNDAIVGYARVRWTDTERFVNPGEAGLTELYVHPDHWQEGIGTALLDRVLDSLPDDTDALVLEALAGNERAQAFSTRRGFVHAGSRTAEFAGDELETAIYRRDL